MAAKRNCTDCSHFRDQRVGEGQQYNLCGGVNPPDTKHECPAYRKRAVPVEDKR